MKKIAIGIDISKEKIDVSVIDAGDPRRGVAAMGYSVFDNRLSGFRRMLAWVRSLDRSVAMEDMLFCCETTGSYDRAMCDYLYAKGLFIWREGALQIKRSMGLRKGKDDKTDSLMIAEYAMRHMDKAVCYETPSESIRNLRELLLYRRRLVQEKTEKKLRMSHLKATGGKGDALNFILRDARRSVTALDSSIRKCEGRILEVIRSDEELRRNYAHVTSVGGIGLVNAVMLITYSNNFKGITTANKMASYYGVAPFRDTSGTSVNKKAYVKCYSNRELKACLTQAAVHSVREHGIYHDYYLRLKEEGKPFGVIINNIRNKLIHLVFALVREDRDYEKGYERNSASRVSRKQCRAGHAA